MGNTARFLTTEMGDKRFTSLKEGEAQREHSLVPAFHL